MTNPALPVFAMVALAGAGLLLWLFLSAAFLLWGARLAGVEKRSFGRAIGTILLGGIASLILKLVLSSAAPVIGTGLGILLGFCVSSVVMMALFDTTFGKALAANLLSWVLSLVAIGGLAILVAFLLAFFVAAAA